MKLTAKAIQMIRDHEANCEEQFRKETQISTMLDFKKTVGKYCNGWASIGFRTDKAEYDINKNNYILNSQDDGWFRKDNSSGITSSHGLMIRSTPRITSRKPQLVGDFVCYKAEIIYETNNFESEIVVDKFWIFVHKEFDIKYVIDYINANIENWRA